MPNTMNAALLILSQPVRAAAQEANAVDTTLSIVHEQKKAGPRAVGGTVSSEISSAQESAMAAGAKASLNSKPQARDFTQEYDAQAAASGFFPLKCTVELARCFADGLGDEVAAYNGQFNLKKTPTYEEYMTKTKEEWVNIAKSRNCSQADIDKMVESNFNEEGYKRLVREDEASNWFLLKGAREATDFSYNIRRFREMFGVDVKINFDKAGRVSVDPFEVKIDGKTVLTYDDHREMVGMDLFTNENYKKRS